jgi:hypothetical protein
MEVSATDPTLSPVEGESLSLKALVDVARRARDVEEFIAEIRRLREAIKKKEVQAVVRGLDPAIDLGRRRGEETP